MGGTTHVLLLLVCERKLNYTNGISVFVFPMVFLGPFAHFLSLVIIMPHLSRILISSFSLQLDCFRPLIKGAGGIFYVASMGRREGEETPSLCCVCIRRQSPVPSSLVCLSSPWTTMPTCRRAHTRVTVKSGYRRDGFTSFTLITCEDIIGECYNYMVFSL